MEKLTKKQVDLLDKLFNLSSADSSILSEINNRIDSYTKEDEETKSQKAEYESKRKSLETELLTFSSQAKDFLSAFGKYNNQSFDSLKNINVDLEIGTMISEVKKNVPSYEKELNREIRDQVNGISSCTKKSKELNKRKNEAEEELEAATDLKNRLSELLDDILVNDNIASYSRGSINKILKEFNLFKEDEIKELEFLILFPENGLKLYQDYKKKPYDLEEPTKEEESEQELEYTEVEFPSDEFIEFKMVSNKEEVKEEAPIEEPKKELEINAPSLKETLDKMKSKKEEPTTEEAKEYVFEEEEEVNKVVEEIKEEDSLNEELTNIGIDLNAITGSNRNNIIKELKNTDMKLLTNNFELLRSLDIKEEDFYRIDNNNYMYLTDSELANKVNSLRGKGIKDNAIKSMILNNGLKMTNESLSARIKQMIDNKEELNDSNLYMLNHDLVNLENNIAKLNEAGMELDAKEKRNYMAVLERCHNIEDLISILTTYVVNLSKRNGKFELNVLLSEPQELLFALDNLIEQGLEDQVSETPEIFDYNIDKVLDRIVYCKENNIPVYDEEENILNEYIYDARAFVSSYPDAKLKKLVSAKETNEELEKALNSSISSTLIKVLNRYYKETTNYSMEITNKELYEELLNSLDSLKIVNTGKNTCRLNQTVISKNKLERNLAIIANNCDDANLIKDNIKETIIVAALYNLRDNNIEDIASECLNN